MTIYSLCKCKVATRVIPAINTKDTKTGKFYTHIHIKTFMQGIFTLRHSSKVLNTKNPGHWTGNTSTTSRCQMEVTIKFTSLGYTGCTEENKSNLLTTLNRVHNGTLKGLMRI
jgi:hypothetical protein